MREKLKANDIAVFTNLDSLAREIVKGAGIDYITIVDFFETIDIHIGDSVFTDMVRERFRDL